MKENNDILQEDTSNRLFGEKFDEKILDFVKIKKKPKEFFNLTDGKSKDSNQSFRGAPSSVQQDGGRIISIFKETKPPHNPITKTEWVSQIPLNFPPVLVNSVPVINLKLPKSSQSSGKSFSSQDKSMFATKGEIFSKELEKVNKRPSNSGNCSRLQNSFLRNSSSNESKQIREQEMMNKYATERCNFESEYDQGSI